MTGQLPEVRQRDGRYRTLLELTGAIDIQNNVQAVLKSLRKLLSAMLHFDGVAMVLLTEDGKSLRLVAFERGLAGSHVEMGSEAPHAGTAAGRAIEEQRTIYVPDIREELSGSRKPPRRPPPRNCVDATWSRFQLPDENSAVVRDSRRKRSRRR